VARGTPVTRVVLVVAVEGAKIEDEGIACLWIRGCVSIPTISMKETGFQDSSIGLKWQKKTRNHLSQDQSRNNVKLGPVKDRRGQLDDVTEVAAKDNAPRVVPYINGLYDLGVASRNVKAELARGRNGAVV